MSTKKQYSPLFLILVTLSVTAMMTANILAAKQIAVFQWNVPAGVLIFPVTYILSDIFSEVYGYKASRRTAWLGFAMNVIMITMFTIAIQLPAPGWFGGAGAFAATLGGTPRIVAAGFIAYMIGDWMNDLSFKRMKNRHRTEANPHKGFKLRAILSSFIGEVVDSAIFLPLAFLGTMPIPVLFQMMVVQVIIKIGYELIILPITANVVKRVAEYEGGVADDSDAGASII